MLKKIFEVFLALVFSFIVTIIGINIYKNSPSFILKRVEEQILATNGSEFDSFKDWVWEPDRTFIFDVCFLNLFCPGTAKMHIAGETKLKNKKAIVMEAFLETNEFFMKMYGAEMTITSAVNKKTKESLWYRELSITTEKKKSKEIIFYPSDGVAIREGMKYKIPPNTYDPLSVFFGFLSSEFIEGKEIILHLLSKEEIYEFRATPEKITENIYKLSGEVRRQDKSSSHGVSFSIFIANDEVRVPLLVKASTAFGPIYLRLRAIQ